MDITARIYEIIEEKHFKQSSIAIAAGFNGYSHSTRSEIRMTFGHLAA